MFIFKPSNQSYVFFVKICCFADFVSELALNISGAHVRVIYSIILYKYMKWKMVGFLVISYRQHHYTAVGHMEFCSERKLSTNI